MEIRRSAANLLLEAPPCAAAGPARLVAGRAVGSAAGARRRLRRPGRHGEGPLAVEPRDTHEPTEAQVHEEEQHREAAAQGDDGYRRRRESAAKEVEGRRPAPQVQVLAGVPAQGARVEPLGPRLPETAVAGGFGGDIRLYSCA